MSRRARLLTGGEAVAHAMRQIDPDVVPVYPITPQTPIIQTFAKFVADGKAHTEIVNVESEHSAMSAAIGAALAGARTMTATSSQGLALMAEVVYIAASMRAPIVMALGNRALSGPINIHCDHSDSMLIRDSGVIQLFAENAQEAYDLTVIAPRLAEHPDVLLPVLVCQDGFTITHSAEPVRPAPGRGRSRLRRRVPHPPPVLDVARPSTQGPFAMPDYYFELRHQQAAAIETALRRARSISRRVRAAERAAARPGRGVPPRRSADHMLVCTRLHRRNDQGRRRRPARRGRAGRPPEIRSFRPFPRRRSRLRSVDVAAVVVLDRADSPGGAPPLYAEVAAALYGSGRELAGSVYGLGGRDLHPEDIRAVFAGANLAHIGLRGTACPV